MSRIEQRADQLVAALKATRVTIPTGTGLDFLAEVRFADGVDATRVARDMRKFYDLVQRVYRDAGLTGPEIWSEVFVLDTGLWHVDLYELSKQRDGGFSHTPLDIVQLHRLLVQHG